MDSVGLFKCCCFLHLYVGMVSAVDEAVGNITTALKERGFMDNALLIFTTDVSK